jgi:hypothetical protein
MTPREVTDELTRMAERYKMEEGRRRVRMATEQKAGNAQAIPETPQSGPDLDEYAYVGSPSPPVQGQPGMPALSGPAHGPYPPVSLPRILNPDQQVQHPEGYTQWDSGWRDPSGVPARYISPSAREMAQDAGEAAFPGAFKLARSGLPAMRLPGIDEKVLRSKIGAKAGIEALRRAYKDEN